MTILADLILKIISSYIGFQKRLMRDKIVKRSFKFSQVLKIEHDSISHDFMRFEKVLFRDENFGLHFSLPKFELEVLGPKLVIFFKSLLWS